MHSRKIARWIQLPLISLAIVMMAAFSAHATTPTAGFVPLGEAHSFKDAPTVYEWRFEEVHDSSPFDKIGLHHVAVGAKPPTNPDLVILYLPGTNMNGIVAPDNVNHSLALYLAVHGADFWAMDYRTHFVPPSASETDLKQLKGWTNELFASDIDEVVKFVRAQTHRDKIFLVGFSRGVAFEYLYTSMHPESVAGIIALDGFISNRPSSEPPANYYAEDVAGEHLTFDARIVAALDFQQAESGVIVLGDYFRGKLIPVHQRNDHAIGAEQHVVDGQNQAVAADQGAGAAPIRA